MWSSAVSLALPLLAGLGADLAPASPEVARTALVRLSVEGLETSEAVTLSLFGDLHIEGIRDRLVPFGPGKFVWLGRARGEEWSAIVLSVSSGVLTGSLRTAAGQFRVRPAGGGLYRVEEVSAVAEPPGKMPLVPLLDGRAAPSFEENDDGSTLDLLVAYTPRARAAAGGELALEALVQLGVAETNLALERSGVATRMRLVDLVETPYRESGRAESDLEILKIDGDGALDELHRLRDAFGADFVQLVVEERDGCGISYALSRDHPAFAEWAFSVVERGCIDSSYAMAHELGHNFGCDHAPEDVTTRGAFPYSFGYKDLVAGFRTIMAYGPGRRIARFSSPRVTFQGFAIGTAGQDNARSIQELRRTLARFRPSLEPPRISVGVVPGKGTAVLRLHSPATRILAWRLQLGTSPGDADRFLSRPLGEDDALEVSAELFGGGGVHLRLWYLRARVWQYEDLRLESSP